MSRVATIVLVSVLSLVATALPAAAQQAAQGAVVFYRPADASPAEVQLTVGAISARLRPGRTVRLSVDAGFAVFGAIAPNGSSSAATLDIVPGVLYAVRVTVRPSGEVTLVQVPTLDAERESAGLQAEGETTPATPTGSTAPATTTTTTTTTSTTTTTTTEPVPTASAGSSATAGRLRGPLAPHEFGGRLLLGANVLGGQVNMGVAGVSGYRFQIDAAGVVHRGAKLTTWVGGNFAFGASVPTALPNYDVQLGAFVMLTFEKLIKIPLVPLVRAGIALDFLVSTTTNVGTAYAFGVRFGGGVYYWLTKWVGLGIDTNFTLGGAAYPQPLVRGCAALTPSSTCGGFSGLWDIGGGAQFAL